MSKVKFHEKLAELEAVIASATDTLESAQKKGAPFEDMIFIRDEQIAAQIERLEVLIMQNRHAIKHSCGGYADMFDGYYYGPFIFHGEYELPQDEKPAVQLPGEFWDFNFDDDGGAL